MSNEEYRSWLAERGLTEPRHLRKTGQPSLEHAAQTRAAWRKSHGISDGGLID